jgi:hypothetical protein
MKTSIICVLELTLGTPREFDLKFRQHVDGFKPELLLLGGVSPGLLMVQGLFVGDINLLQHSFDGFELRRSLTGYHMAGLLDCPPVPYNKSIRLTGCSTNIIPFEMGKTGDPIEIIARLDGSLPAYSMPPLTRGK